MATVIILGLDANRDVMLVQLPGIHVRNQLLNARDDKLEDKT